MRDKELTIWKRFLRLFRSRVPIEHRKEFEDKRLETNMSRMFALSIYIICIQVVLNLINIIKGMTSSGESSGGDEGLIPTSVYVALSMGTLLVGVIYFVLFLLVRKKKITLGKTGKMIMSQSLLYLYVCIQLTFSVFNILMNAGLNSFIIAALILCLFPILPPLQSILSELLAFAAMLATMFIARDASETWNTVTTTDTWTNLIIIVSLVLCVSVFIYNLYVSNFMQSIELVDANMVLENTVNERTKELEKQTLTAQIASKSKSEFLARMSHEIRTPLNAIIGMMQIAEETTDNEKTLKALGQISTASDHLLGILNDVLDMSKIESGKMTIMHQSMMLKKAMQEVNDIIALSSKNKNIEFVSNVDKLKEFTVLSDKLRLKQVLINLLGNAVKFTPEGGKILFDVNVLDETKDFFEVEFIVRDNGIGMKPEQLPRIFSAFEQTDGNIAVIYGGTGLGLTISQKLINNMGGAIGVESEVGVGSKFFFTLKLEKGSETMASEIKGNEDLKNVDVAGRRILLAEDIDINRLIVKELLFDTKVRISEAVDGISAVEMFSKSDEFYYDLIIMDIQMPGMNGYEATEAIRKLKRKDAKVVPIIAMTANAYKEDIDKAIESGMNGHIAKPVEKELLVRTIKENVKK